MENATRQAELLNKRAQELAESVSRLSAAMEALNKKAHRSRMAIIATVLSLFFAIVVIVLLVVFYLRLNQEQLRTNVLYSDVICPLYQNGLSQAETTDRNTLSDQQRILLDKRVQLLVRGITELRCS